MLYKGRINPDIFRQHLINGNIINIAFINEDAKDYFITSQICNYNFKDIRYKQVIFNYLYNSYGNFFFQKDWLSHTEIIRVLLNEELYSFYIINEFILEEDCISNLLLDLDNLIDAINLLMECYKSNCEQVPWFEGLCEERLYEAINLYVQYIDVSTYCENYEYTKKLYKNAITLFIQKIANETKSLAKTHGKDWEE